MALEYTFYYLLCFTYLLYYFVKPGIVSYRLSWYLALRTCTKIWSCYGLQYYSQRHRCQL